MWTLAFFLLIFVTSTLAILGVTLYLKQQKIGELSVQLLETKLTYKQILLSLEDGFWSLDNCGNTLFVNSHLEKMLGYKSDELIGLPATHYLEATEINIFKENFKQIKGGHREVFESSLLNRDGNICEIRINMNPIFKNEEFQGCLLQVKDFSEVKRDRDERKNLKEQLQQSQNLEALGILAGGIAHDFNNILQGIYASLEIAQQENDKTERLAILDSTINFTLRGRDLVHQILAFCRQQGTQREALDFKSIVLEVFKLIRLSLPSTIDVQLDIEESDSFQVFGDPSQLHQIITNLCTNAGYSMLESGGNIQLSLKSKKLGTQSAQKLNIPPGDYATLSVKDSGTGISYKIHNRIFEPFFTTKPLGEGTGMGLSVVHGHVLSHSGAIELESDVGKGAVFTVYLPISAMETKTEPLVQKIDSKVFSKKLNILLVDDEVEIADLIRDSLSDKDMFVKSAYDATQAIEEFYKLNGNFDILVTDQSMPKTSGAELAKFLKSKKPELKVIMCSGRNFEMGPEYENLIDASVLKPFNTGKLKETIYSLV